MANVSKEKDVFIAPNATVIGNVSLGSESSVWFNAVLRGDGDAITIGKRTNIQDGAIIHVDPGFPVMIGDEVIVGHAAMHVLELDDLVLVGLLTLA